MMLMESSWVELKVSCWSYDLSICVPIFIFLFYSIFNRVSQVQIEVNDLGNVQMLLLPVWSWSCRHGFQMVVLPSFQGHILMVRFLFLALSVAPIALLFLGSSLSQPSHPLNWAFTKLPITNVLYSLNDNYMTAQKECMSIECNWHLRIDIQT